MIRWNTAQNIELSHTCKVGLVVLRLWFFLCVCVCVSAINLLPWFLLHFYYCSFQFFYVAQYIIGGPTTTLDMYGYLMVSMGINGYVLVYMGIYGYICVCVGKDEHGIDFRFVNCKNYNFQFNFKGIKYWNYSNLLIVPKSWILISLGTVPILRNNIWPLLTHSSPRYQI